MIHKPNPLDLSFTQVAPAKVAPRPEPMTPGARMVAVDVPEATMAQCPPCFTREFWRDWLEVALAKNTPGSAAVRDAVAAGVTPFPCEDCTTAHERRMRQQGRCTREQLIVIVPPKAGAASTASVAGQALAAQACAGVDQMDLWGGA